MSDSTPVESNCPKPGLSGFSENFAADVRSGFLVFLIAMPLCLGIAKASGYPPIAGVFTAIVGGLIVPWISNSELTIKGPAAGLIVIVLGCVDGFKETLAQGDEYQAYRLALGVSVVAGVLQILLALLRSGVLSEFFPTAAVHGMLASIGVMIATKQFHAMVGEPTKLKEPLQVIEAMPDALRHMNPVIALIGLVCLAIMFFWPKIGKRVPALKPIPAQLVVVVVGIAMGFWLDLDTAHPGVLLGSPFEINPKTALVDVPANIQDGITFPDFSGVLTKHGLLFIVMFTLIGTLESLLSAKAVDLLDPHRRKTDYNRDMLGVGLANTLVAFIGGLPMISEIVRSKANIDNGARSRFANMFHGLFLLLFVALLPGLIHRIPTSALAAMLVFTGCRLASPSEFIHMYKVGRQQLVIFVATIVGVLATDLLIGVGVGVAVKWALHVWNGAPLLSLFKTDVEIIQTGDTTTLVRVNNSAVFSTWIALRKRLLAIDESQSVILDLSGTRFVDHTVMEKLHELQSDFERKQRRFVIQGLEQHSGLSQHPFAARKRAADPAMPPHKNGPSVI